MLDPVLPHVFSLNAVLISHPDFTHMGGLPYILKERSEPLPIYINDNAYALSSFLTSRANIAMICLEDAYENWLEGQETCVFDRDDMRKVYDSFEKLTYNQSGIISNKKGIVVKVKPYVLFSPSPPSPSSSNS